MSRTVKIDPYRVTIRVNPELAEAALREDCSMEFATWLIARKLDSLCGSGGGKVPRGRLTGALAALFGCSEVTVRRRLADSLGAFWREGRDGTLYLCGVNQVALRLGVEGFDSRPFGVPLWWFGLGLRTVRAMLLGCVAARDGRPVSVEGLAERCGMCERTAQYLLKIMDAGWSREENYRPSEPNEVAGPRRRKGMRVAGQAVPVSLERIPDSFELPFARRSVSRQAKRYRQFRGVDERHMRPRGLAGGTVIYVEEMNDDCIRVVPRKVWNAAPKEQHDER